MKAEAPECFAALGLKAKATVAQVKRAYRKLCKKHHPDTGGDAEAFRNLTEKYEAALQMADGPRLSIGIG